MTAPAGTQAVVRALRLLKQLARTGRPLELNELAAGESLSRSTTYRLLGALESEGLALYDPRRRVWSLATAASSILGDRRQRLIQRTRPALESLAARFGETATLEALDGDSVVILDEVQGPRLVTAAPEVGTRWTLHATSSGKAMLSRLPESEGLDLLPDRLGRSTKATVVDRRSLAVELEEARRHGFAMASGELEEGYAASAAAFCDHGELCAVSVGGPVSRLGHRRLTEIGVALAELAASLTR